MGARVSTEAPAMAAPQRPSSTTATASACVPETARGTHAFTVAGYRLHKGLGAGNFIRSATFSVGGYDWCIRYYPDGYSKDTLGHVSVCVELLTEKSVVRALYDLKLTNHATGVPSLISSRRFSLPAFNSCKKNMHFKGVGLWMKKDILEASPYLQDDRIVIHCDMTVVLKDIPAVATAKTPEVQVPPSDLSCSLAKLLEEKKGADVTIHVDGETFYAHKMVLAMRSPVFDAELNGRPMLEPDNNKQCVQIADMQPAVFKALLHFIYTDSLPAMDDLVDKRERTRHLLVAADRYAMTRMKLMCESMLCKSLSAKSVVATLALAERHQCGKLREACIQYIKLIN